MNDLGWLGEFLNTVKFQLPYILVDLTGILLCIAYWQRWPTPCRLALAGFLIKLTMAISYPLVSALLIRERRLGQFEAISFVMFIIDAVGDALVLTALFYGRNSAAPRLPPPWWDEPAEEPLQPTLPLPDDTGIVERKP